jgi:hypothetical protein
MGPRLDLNSRLSTRARQLAISQPQFRANILAERISLGPEVRANVKFRVANPATIRTALGRERSSAGMCPEVGFRCKAAIELRYERPFRAPEGQESDQTLAQTYDVFPFGTVFAPVISLSGDTT